MDKETDETKSDTFVPQRNEHDICSGRGLEESPEENGESRNGGKESLPVYEICVDKYQETDKSVVAFKKPDLLIGPRRCRLSDGKIRKSHDSSATLNTTNDPSKDVRSFETTVERPDNATNSRDIGIEEERLKDLSLTYLEPPWGGKPTEDYKIEVLKSGVIVETISLSDHSFHVVGRLPSCHLSLAHPTASRYHAVLQYRSHQDDSNSKGMYVYDLGSTHGTFWNGSRIKPNVYVRVRGGHILKFGCSQRKYILQAPQGDHDAESEYTLFELKERRAQELETRRMAAGVPQQGDKPEVGGADKESQGIDWGMREDADETSDSEENPYAAIVDDDLVLDDPKKTLRGWFEREGYDLQYQTEEKGIGQFLCWVNLPMESITGHSVRAEALVKGKKKEAVVQCALEACRVLDKYGLLRQANHEARKRKQRNWEEEDYYDSDEDNFLDRTGTVEKKREQRMRLAGKLEEKVETYDSLLKQYDEISKRIVFLTNSIENWQSKGNSQGEDANEEDALDAFMSSLNSSVLTKSDVAKTKQELQNLRKKELSLIKLLNLTRPADLPPLVRQSTTSARTTDQTKCRRIVDQRSVTRRPRTTQKHRAHHTFNVNTNSVAPSSTRAEFMDAESDDELDEETKNKMSLGDEKQRRIDSCCGIVSDVGNSNSKKSEAKDSSMVERKKKHELRLPMTSTDERRVEISEATEGLRPNVSDKTRVEKKSRDNAAKLLSDQDVYAENYSMWVPPQDQAGDGKTDLNEKYGY